jgi:hypothetical protein
MSNNIAYKFKESLQLLRLTCRLPPLAGSRAHTAEDPATARTPAPAKPAATERPHVRRRETCRYRTARRQINKSQRSPIVQARHVGPRARAHHAAGSAALLLLQVLDLKSREEQTGERIQQHPVRVNSSQISARHGADLPALLARARSDEAATVPGPATVVVQAPVAAAAVVGAPISLPPHPRMRPPPRLPRPRHLVVHLRRVLRI